jgi:glucokinase
LNEIVIGIDIGGTMVRAGAVARDGHILSIGETTILASEGPQAGMKRITALVESIVNQNDARLLGIGIGCTGPLDLTRGAIQNPYTLPGWEDVPITGPLQDHFSVPVLLENDADVAALGEYWVGAGQNMQRLVAVTVGTGIGTSLILKGQIYRGLEDCHPEGGHIILDPSGPLCYCGAYGCWESLAAGPAITKQARQAAVQHPESLMLSLAGGDLDKVDSAVAVQAARQQDAAACQVIERAAHYTALGIVNLINAFAPEMIVLSGGVMKSSDLFLPEIMKVVHQNNRMVPADHIQIVLAKLGYYAGMTGAAYTIYQKQQ